MRRHLEIGDIVAVNGKTGIVADIFPGERLVSVFIGEEKKTVGMSEITDIF